MFYRRHHTRDKLQEEEQTIFDTRLTSIALYLIYHALHDCGVVARVNAQLLAGQFGVRLEGYRFLRVVRHDVLVHLLLRQQLSLL